MGQGTSQTVTWVVNAFLGAPADLPSLPDVESVSPRVWRVLGQNPGQATLQGTNTYIVGRGAKRVLIDTSDGNSHWWPLVEQVLTSESAYVDKVVLTHAHYDHVGGIPALRSAFPKAQLYKCFASEEDTDDAIIPPPPAWQLSPGSLRRGELTEAFSSPNPKGSRHARCGCDGEVPADCLPLRESQVIDSDDGACCIRVILTPGHSDDSICLVLESAGGIEAVFTGDTILGGRTAMFNDLRPYGASLRRLLSLCLDHGGFLLLPGHGSAVKADDSTAYLSSMINQQSNRERAILKALETSPGSSASDLCDTLYSNTSAAAMAVDIVVQHLVDLEKRGRVKSDEGLFGTSWEVCSSQPDTR